MTAALDRTDMRIVWLAVSLMVLLTALGLLFGSGTESTSRGVASTYSADGSGAKAAYLLLGELGYRVERWQQPVEDLPTAPEGTVLIIAGPTVLPTDEERRQLKQFVSAGGRAVITGWMGASMIGVENLMTTDSAIDEWQSFKAEAPASATLGAPEISMESSTRWGRLGFGEQRYYGDDKGATVVRVRRGKGEIIWWADESPLTNYGISQASNLALFLNCVASSGDARVLWDEYFHGVRTGLWYYVARTPLPWALLQLVVLAVFVMVTYGRRSGVVRPLRRESRFSPLEFVETLGALYERKGAAAGALEIAFARFRFLLARRLGLPSSATTAELIRSMRERPSRTTPDIAAVMERIESAVKAQEVEESAALTWIDTLYDFAQRLRLEG